MAMLNNQMVILLATIHPSFHLDFSPQNPPRHHQIVHVFGDPTKPARLSFHPAATSDAQGVVEAAVVDFEFAGPGLVAVAWPGRVGRRADRFVVLPWLPSGKLT